MKKNLYSYLHREFADWRFREVIYIVICTAAITGISIRLGDNGWGIASAVTGTLYTMLAGKGKISCYLFGIINTLLYGWIAKSATLYGDMMLNWFVYLPMMFAGLIMWRSRRDENGCIYKTALSGRGRITTAAINVLAIILYGFILLKLGDQQPFIDSATTVLSVTAMILTLKRCVEQWLLWIAVNILSVAMWLKVWMVSGNSIATLLWWIIMLITGIIFFVQWCADMNTKRQIANTVTE